MSKPSPELKANLFKAIAKEPSPTRKVVGRQTKTIFVTSIFLAIAEFLLLGGIRQSEESYSWLVFAGTLAMFVTIVATTKIMIVLNQTSANVRKGQLVLGVVLCGGLSIVAAKTAYITMFFGGVDDRIVGFSNKCFLTLAIGVIILTVYTYIFRNSDPLHPHMTGASLGIVSGVSATILTELWCPFVTSLYSGLSLILPILILGSIGWLFGMKFIRLQPHHLYDLAIHDIPKL